MKGVSHVSSVSRSCELFKEVLLRCLEHRAQQQDSTWIEAQDGRAGRAQCSACKGRSTAVEKAAHQPAAQPEQWCQAQRAHA